MNSEEVLKQDALRHLATLLAAHKGERPSALPIFHGSATAGARAAEAEQCDICEEKPTFKKGGLKAHMMNTHSLLKYPCECGNAFATKAKKKRHWDRCGKNPNKKVNKTFKCKWCDNKLSSQNALTNHHYSKHAAILSTKDEYAPLWAALMEFKNKHRCVRGCKEGTPFASTRNLNRHMQREHGQKPNTSFAAQKMLREAGVQPKRKPKRKRKPEVEAEVEAEVQPEVEAEVEGEVQPEVQLTYMEKCRRKQARNQRKLQELGLVGKWTAVAGLRAGTNEGSVFAFPV